MPLTDNCLPAFSAEGPEVRISFCGGQIVLALTLAVSNCRGSWNKNRTKRAGRTERPGRNPNSGQRMLAPGDQGPRSSSAPCYETRTHPAQRYTGSASCGRPEARPEMIWKHQTPDWWMRIGFTVLVLVGVICTLLIVVARLR